MRDKARTLSRVKLLSAVQNTYDDAHFLVGIGLDENTDFRKGPTVNRSLYVSKQELLETIAASDYKQFRSMPTSPYDIVLLPYFFVYKHSINESQIFSETPDIQDFQHYADISNPHFDVYCKFDHAAKTITFALAGRRVTLPLVEGTGWVWKVEPGRILCSSTEHLELHFQEELWNPIAVHIGRQVLEIKDVI